MKKKIFVRMTILWLVTAIWVIAVGQLLADRTAVPPTNPPDDSTFTWGPYKPANPIVGNSGVSLETAFSQSAISEWQIECVDCPHYFGATNRSVQLDQNGRPHIVYGYDHLYHAWYDDTTWHIETVDNSPRVGSHATLVLDEAGYPHISYYDNNTPGLKYAWYDGTSWHTEMVISGQLGWFTSIALDNNGHPHISHCSIYGPRGACGGLMYSYSDGTNWYTEWVEGYFYTGRNSSIAIDSLNQPHIAYTYESSADIRYAWRDGTNWHIETIDNTTGSDGGSTSLILDVNDQPHLSYYSGLPDYDLKYAWRNSTGWQIETVDSEGDVGLSSSLIFNTLEQPHISYLDWTNHNLKYAWQDGAGWHTEMVEGGANASGSSLALDEANEPHIAAVNYALELLYAWQGDSDWHVTIVDTSAWRGGYTSLALDTTDQPHISYSNYETGLWYAQYDNTTWQLEEVDHTSQDRAWYTSLVLDSHEQSQIAYYDYDYPSSELIYTRYDGINWLSETVQSVGYVYSSPSLALDQFDHPHLSYHDLPGFTGEYGNLKYAWHDGTEWHIEVVDSHPNGDVGSFASLALDSDGHPHISYGSHVSQTSSLKYAWHDGTNWHIETVNSDEGNGISLVLDGQGQPHLTLCGDGLKYIRYNSTYWQNEMVDATVYCGYDSLALDSAGRPRISYYDYREQNLKYAWYDGINWHVEIIDSAGWVGEFASLALDSHDRPFISYADSSNGDLKLASLENYLELTKTAVPQDGVGHTDLLTFTLSLYGSGELVYLSDPLPDNIKYITDTLTGTVSPTAVYSPSLHAVIWEGILPLGTVETIEFQVTPVFTQTGPMLPPILNTAWLTAIQRDVTISATALVNGWRVYLPVVLRP